MATGRVMQEALKWRRAMNEKDAAEHAKKVRRAAEDVLDGVLSCNAAAKARGVAATLVKSEANAERERRKVAVTT
jgi:hypothetical protein